MPRLILSFAMMLTPAAILAVPMRPNSDSQLMAKTWGTPVDPDQDCTFRLDRDSLHIGIPGKPHIMSFEIGKTNGPRVMREAEGDFSMEVTVSGPIPSDSRSLIEGRWAYFGAGLLVWQDEKNYIRLERARMYFPDKGWRCYPGFEQRQDGKVARGWKYEDGVLDETKPANLKMTRKANTIAASFSQDGKWWRDIDSVQGDFGKKLRIGVHAVQNSPAGFEAVYSGLKIVTAEKGKDR